MALVASAVLAVLIAAAQTPVEQARSNIAGWYEELSSYTAPSWLNDTNVDDVVTWGGILGLALIASFLMYYQMLFRSKRRQVSVLPAKNPMTIISKEPISTDVPDYAAWDELDQMPLWQVACLWAEVEPKRHLQGRSLVVFQRLQMAIVKSDLDAQIDISTEIAVVTKDLLGWDHPSAYQEIPEYLLVSRSALRAYALDANSKPPFLFPEVR